MEPEKENNLGVECKGSWTRARVKADKEIRDRTDAMVGTEENNNNNKEKEEEKDKGKGSGKKEVKEREKMNVKDEWSKIAQERQKFIEEGLTLAEERIKVEESTKNLEIERAKMRETLNEERKKLKTLWDIERRKIEEETKRLEEERKVVAEERTKLREERARVSDVRERLRGLEEDNRGLKEENERLKRKIEDLMEKNLRLENPFSSAEDGAGERQESREGSEGIAGVVGSIGRRLGKRMPRSSRVFANPFEGENYAFTVEQVKSWFPDSPSSEQDPFSSSSSTSAASEDPTTTLSVRNSILLHFPSHIYMEIHAYNLSLRHAVNISPPLRRVKAQQSPGYVPKKNKGLRLSVMKRQEWEMETKAEEDALAASSNTEELSQRLR